MLTPEGQVFAEVADEAERSMIAEYWNAVGRYIDTGDGSAVRAYEGREVAGLTLETDLDAIDDAGRAGDLAFEDIYEGP